MEPTRPSDLAIVKDLAFNLLQRSTLRELMWDLAEAIGALPGFEDSVVYLREGDQLRQIAAYGMKARSLREVVDPISIDLGDGIVGAVAATQEAEIIPDTRLDSRYISDLFCGLSELTVPVVFEGKTLAVLDTECDRVNGYDESDLEILQTMANIAAPRVASAIRERETVLAREELARLNHDLEQRIQTRTDVLKQTASLLRSERDRVVAILDSIDFGVVSVDDSLSILSASRAAKALLGVADQNIDGLELGSVFLLEGVDDLKVEVRRRSESSVRSETVLQTPNGPCLVRWTANRPGRDRDTGGYIVVFRDCTHEKFLAEQASRVQRLESVGVLAAGIAHNFNNYLAAIVSSVDAARLTSDAQLRAEMLRNASQGCIESRQLTQELLTYSLGGAPVREAVRVADVVGSSVSLSTSGQRVQVCLDIPDDLPDVFADAGQLTQVLSNVLLNAVQAMPHGGRITLSARADQAGENVMIAVTDTGPGIRDDAIQKLFDPYFTTRESGTGLGLTTSYFIVRGHGGSMVARNRESGGAEFVITIPVSSKPGKPGFEAPEDRDDVALHILVLDDERHVRRSVSSLLQAIGHVVCGAESIEEAKSVVQTAVSENRPVHAAIVDLTLGQETGVDAVKELHQLSPKTSFIVSSGYSDDPVMANFREHGFDGVLRKPYSADELTRVLASVRNVS